MAFHQELFHFCSTAQKSAPQRLVRARIKEHIIQLFPDADYLIQRDEEADYRWRLLVSKSELTSAVSSYITQNLNYDNFKAAQEADDPAWPRFFNAVWGEGLRLQN